MIMFLLPERLRKSLQIHRPVQWLLSITSILIVLCIILTVAFKYAENVDWEEAVWQTFQTITTIGYGNKPAETLAGRVITMTFAVLGIAFLTTLIGTSFAVYSYVQHRRCIGMCKNPYENGYVIFNFPGEDNMLGLIREIRVVEQDIGFCILDNTLKELPARVGAIDKVHFIRGCLIDEDTFKKAELRKNKTMIIFPADPSSSDSDGLTSKLVDLIRQFVKDKPVIHVQVDESHKWLFNGTSVPIWQHLEILAIVQECQDPGSAVAVQKLLKNTEGANPRSVNPRLAVGLTWFEFQIGSIQAAKELDIEVNPFALIQSGEAYTCPKMDTQINSGDRIIIIAHTDFDWDSFERSLVKSVVKDCGAMPAVEIGKSGDTLLISPSHCRELANPELKE